VETIDYRLKSGYNSDGKHILRGFFIGTKPNQRDWSVDKDTILEQARKNIGSDFIVDLDLLNGKDGHVYSDDYEELKRLQKPVVRGKLTNVFGPFPYEDGTDDVYVDAEIDLQDKIVSESLAAGKLPLATSPYIFPTKDGKPFSPKNLESRHGIKDWIVGHLALVKNGAFGWRAALSKQCFGPEGVCHSALAASSEETAASISSLLHSEGQSTQMSDANAQNLSGPAGTTNVVPTVDNAPIKSNTQNTPNTNSTQVSVEQFAELSEKLAVQTKVNEKLVLRHKTDALNKIFGSVSDEAEKAKIIKKWLGAEDVDILADFHNDILNLIVPTLKVKEEKPAKNALAASEEDCGCSKHKKEEDKTDFPLAGSSSGVTSRLTREKSLTELLGGA